jgi:SAM-dependent methyltransferase
MMSTYVEKAFSFLKKASIEISGAWIDCGCGYGHYLKALALLGACPVIAVDSSITRLTGSGLPAFVVVGDCRCLPVKPGSVSGFLYVNVLHYYKFPHPLVEEAYRVLKNNGHIIIIEYDQPILAAWNPYPLTADNIEHLLKRSGFDPVKKSGVDLMYRPKHLVVGIKGQHR